MEISGRTRRTVSINFARASGIGLAIVGLKGIAEIAGDGLGAFGVGNHNRLDVPVVSLVPNLPLAFLHLDGSSAIEITDGVIAESDPADLDGLIRIVILTKVEARGGQFNLPVASYDLVRVIDFDRARDGSARILSRGDENRGFPDPHRLNAKLGIGNRSDRRDRGVIRVDVQAILARPIDGNGEFPSLTNWQR